MRQAIDRITVEATDGDFRPRTFSAWFCLIRVQHHVDAKADHTLNYYARVDSPQAEEHNGASTGCTYGKASPEARPMASAALQEDCPARVVIFSARSTTRISAHGRGRVRRINVLTEDGDQINVVRMSEASAEQMLADHHWEVAGGQG